MKELSTEEKAKRYNEVLKQIKECIPDENGFITIYPQEIFPELKESEDERIRKELLEHCKNQAEPYIQTGNKCPQIQSWITWLEKQGEQKLADKVEPIFNVGDKIQYSKGCGTIMTIEKIENGEYIFANNMGHTTIESGNKWHLVEQNPAEWSEEDEKVINDIMWIIEAYRKNGFNETHMQVANSSEEWIKSIKDRVQPKREWNEEDENRFNNLCWLIDQSDENEPTKNGFKNWLKYRALPQPKQEWSEEDEKHRLNCLSYFNMIEKTSPYYEDYLWLKSIKERVQPQKQEWSEDYINDLIKYFSQNKRLKNTKEDIVIWLKSLRNNNNNNNNK